MPKGGESISPKAKGPHHHVSKFFETNLSFKCSSIGIFEISIPLRNSISLVSIFERGVFQN
jgi:hypothetical protein